MKNIHLFLACTVILCGINSVIYAQNNRIERNLKDSTEVKVQNETYRYDRKLKIIQNVKNKAENWKNLVSADDFAIRDTADITKIYRSVFSNDRIMELQNDKLTIVCLCNHGGIVKEVKFFVSRCPEISMEELHALEDAIKHYKFEISHKKGEKQKYCMFSIPCIFNRLQ